MPQAWPVNLPTAVLEEGYSEARPDNVIRSPMDVGPPKVRRRTTAAVYPLFFSQQLTTAQVATLVTFYDSTLAHGSLSFTLEHPRTGGEVEAMFAAPPRIVPWPNADGYWRADYQIEVYP
jgi:hypothetical protein